MDFKEIENKIIIYEKQDQLLWATALAGEVGEFCNLIKKQARGDIQNGVDFLKWKQDITHELADIFIYLSLNAKIHHIDLEDAILCKLKIIEQRLRER